MQIIKNRGFAITAAAIVMALSTLLGVHRSVGKQADNIEDMFYDGVYIEDGSYNEASIGSQLEQRAGGAMTLWSIASNYELLSGEAEALRAARSQLISAETISEKYDANAALEDALDALKEKLGSVSLNDRDSAEAENCVYKMESAQRLIESSGYNSEVEAFKNETLRQFPVRYLKSLAFCDYPEAFA